MAENPDREHAKHGKFAPSQGDLRLVHMDEGKAYPSRILQRWEWSYTDARYRDTLGTMCRW